MWDQNGPPEVVASPPHHLLCSDALYLHDGGKTHCVYDAREVPSFHRVPGHIFSITIDNFNYKYFVIHTIYICLAAMAHEPHPGVCFHPGPRQGGPNPI